VIQRFDDAPSGERMPPTALASRLLGVLWWRYFDSLSEKAETSCSESESTNRWFACSTF